jgi:signal recognition particle subunit SRP19
MKRDEIMSETMIWPIYLDKDKSLSQGRKISTEYAISEPRIREIEKAAKRLGYTFIVETDKSYPGEWYANSGRIIISSEESKKEILIKLSAQIKTIRETKKSSGFGKKGKKRKNK